MLRHYNYKTIHLRHSINSATICDTCSAIAGAAVSPGDSNPHQMNRLRHRGVARDHKIGNAFAARRNEFGRSPE